MIEQSDRVVIIETNLAGDYEILSTVVVWGQVLKPTIKTTLACLLNGIGVRRLSPDIVKFEESFETGARDYLFASGLKNKLVKVEANPLVNAGLSNRIVGARVDNEWQSITQKYCCGGGVVVLNNRQNILTIGETVRFNSEMANIEVSVKNSKASD